MSLFQLSGQRTFPLCDWKLLFQFILSFLLPNIVFFGIAYYLHATRLIINIDYILPCLLLLFHNRLIRSLGIILFIVLMLVETHLLLLKFFPFLDFAMIRDLFPFIFIGPKQYLILFCLVLFCIVLILCLSWYLNKDQKKFYPVVFSIFITLTYLYAGYMYFFTYQDDYSYDENQWTTKPFYINSQFSFYKDKINEFKKEFVFHLHLDAQLVDYIDDNKIGSDNLIQPYNSKILFIVAESFGVLNNDEAQQDIFKELYKKSEHFEFIENGYLKIPPMATVEAEFRELCKKSITNGFKFKNTNEQEFQSCLPQILKNQGYQTTAFHGAMSVMYDRNNIYPKFGFQKNVFDEDMNNKKRCRSFPGICDSEIFSLIANEFKNNNKLFVYWLTLTSHYPYNDKDIFNHRFACEKYNIIENGNLCRNIKMQIQFIDQLAQLSEQSEMKGVEVILVGDHPVPGIAITDTLLTEEEQVAFLHFKIKE